MRASAFSRFRLSPSRYALRRNKSRYGGTAFAVRWLAQTKLEVEKGKWVVRLRASRFGGTDFA